MKEGEEKRPADGWKLLTVDRTRGKKKSQKMGVNEERTIRRNKGERYR